MRVTCPKCGLVAMIDPALVAERAPVMCPRCERIFTAAPDGEVARAAAAGHVVAAPTVPEVNVGGQSAPFEEPYEDVLVLPQDEPEMQQDILAIPHDEFETHLADDQFQLLEDEVLPPAHAAAPAPAAAPSTQWDAPVSAAPAAAPLPLEEPALELGEAAWTIDDPAAHEEFTWTIDEAAAETQEPAPAVEEPLMAMEEPSMAMEEPLMVIEEPVMVMEEPAAPDQSAVKDWDADFQHNDLRQNDFQRNDFEQEQFQQDDFQQGQFQQGQFQQEQFQQDDFQLEQYQVEDYEEDLTVEVRAEEEQEPFAPPPPPTPEAGATDAPQQLSAPVELPWLPESPARVTHVQTAFAPEPAAPMQAATDEWEAPEAEHDWAAPEPAHDWAAAPELAADWAAPEPAVTDSVVPDSAVQDEPSPDHTIETPPAVYDKYEVGVRLMRISPVWLLLSAVGFVALLFICSRMIRPSTEEGALAQGPEIHNQATNQSSTPAAKPALPAAPRPADGAGAVVANPEAAQAAGVAARPKAAAQTQAPEKQKAQESAPAAKPAPMPNPENPGGAAGGFTVQTSSHSDPAVANQEVSSLRAAGFEARAVQVEIPKRGTWYRVQAGRFRSRAEAAAQQSRMKSKGKAAGSFITEAGQ